MREILFRGKRVDNGEWLEGYFHIKYFQELPHDRFVIQYKPNENVYKWTPEYMVAEIDPATIGQYTGLTDKNGNKIFEGDIIDTPDRLISVVWFKGNAQFDLKFIKYAHDIVISNFKGIEMRDLYDYEVIGNIHDNPELLGGAE